MKLSWNKFNKLYYLECACSEHGVVDEICNQDNGFCLCKPTYGNPYPNSISEKCDYCYEGYYGFPHCESRYFCTYLISMNCSNFSFTQDFSMYLTFILIIYDYQCVLCNMHAVSLFTNFFPLGKQFFSKYLFGHY